MVAELFSALESLGTTIGMATRNRCVQIVCEYLPTSNILKFMSTIPNRYLEECKAALASWYNEDSSLSTDWIRETLMFDSYLLAKVSEKIMTRLTSPLSVTPYKRLLIYAYRLHTSSCRWYVDTEPCRDSNMITGHSCTDLVLLRKAYEHVLFTQKSLLDVIHPAGLLKSLHRPEDAYKHSSFYRHTKQKPGIVLYDGNDRQLTLYPESKKTFQVKNVQCALELIETNSPVERTLVLRCCKALNHNHVFGEGLDLNFVYDKKNSVFPNSRGLACSSSALSRRLTDLSAGPNCRRQLKPIPPFTCEKMNILHNHLSNPNRERDFATLKCFVQEYLLQELARTRN